MTTERQRPEIRPNILENPVHFVSRVSDVRLNNTPKEIEDFKSWLLDQWAQIDSRISQKDFELIIRPYNGRPRGFARNLRVSDKIHLTERDGSPGVELRYGRWLRLSPDNKGEHMMRMQFTAESKAKRDLVDVFIEDQSVDVDSEGKPFAKRKGFKIKVSPDLTIRELAEHESF